MDRWISARGPEDLIVEPKAEELVGLVANARAYLGNDSGITHLAAMLRVPGLALFKSSDPSIWQPFGKEIRLSHDPRGAVREMERLVNSPP